MGKLTKLMGSPAPVGSPDLDAALAALVAKTAATRSMLATVGDARNAKASADADFRTIDNLIGEAQLRRDTAALNDLTPKLEAAERASKAADRLASAGPGALKAEAADIDRLDGDVRVAFQKATGDAQAAALATVRKAARDLLAGLDIVRALRLERAELPLAIRDPLTGEHIQPAHTAEETALLGLAARVAQVLGSAQSAATSAAVGPGFGMGFAPARRVG